MVLPKGNRASDRDIGRVITHHPTGNYPSVNKYTSVHIDATGIGKVGSYE